MIARRGAAFAFLLMALVPLPATADPEECREAIDKYNTAIGDISYAIRRYSTCVSGSQAHDDCSSEFRRVKSAQDDFEDAVTAYGTDCQ
jgi:hypothetical protein